MAQDLATLARAAADRRRKPKVPLTRREALQEAPWSPELPGSERTFRRAYATRLIERGIAEPAPAWASGSRQEYLQIVCPRDDQDRYRAAAKASGESVSAWVRRAAETQISREKRGSEK
jgi:hypothetical protein